MVALPNVLLIWAAPLLGTVCSPARLPVGHLQASWLSQGHSVSNKVLHLRTLCLEEI